MNEGISGNSGEDGGVGGVLAYLIPWIHINNIHISVNVQEKDLKTGRTDSLQLN